MPMTGKQTQSVWLFYLTLVFASPASAESLVSLLWEARGVEAVHQANAIGIELSWLQGQKRVNRLCELMLEQAFAMHQSTNTMGQMVQKESRDFKHFHVLLTDTSGLFDIQYMYAHSGTLVTTKIDQLPKGWTILHQILKPNKIQVSMPDVTPELPGCIFEFDVSDPFSAKVLP